MAATNCTRCSGGMQVTPTSAKTGRAAASCDRRLNHLGEGTCRRRFIGRHVGRQRVGQGAKRLEPTDVCRNAVLLRRMYPRIPAVGPLTLFCRSCSYLVRRSAYRRAGLRRCRLAKYATRGLRPRRKTCVRARRAPSATTGTKVKVGLTPTSS